MLGNVKIAVFRNGELIPLGTGHTVDVLAQDKYVEGVLTREDALSMLQEKEFTITWEEMVLRKSSFTTNRFVYRKRDVVAIFSNGMQESVTWKEMEGLPFPEETLQENGI